jgi:hypothetical protein
VKTLVVIAAVLTVLVRRPLRWLKDGFYKYNY